MHPMLLLMLLHYHPLPDSASYYAIGRYADAMLDIHCNHRYIMQKEIWMSVIGYRSRWVLMAKSEHAEAYEVRGKYQDYFLPILRTENGDERYHCILFQHLRLRTDIRTCQSSIAADRCCIYNSDKSLGWKTIYWRSCRPSQRYQNCDTRR